MAWKCNIRPSKVTVEPRVKSFCSEVFAYDHKMFLIDYAGNPDDLSEELYLPVMVEAYRTTKELLSLLKQRSPWALSVWSSDVAEANEVAFGVNSPLVWINDYGVFTGPPRASQVFYSNVYKANHYDMTKEELELRNAWCKLSVADRVDASRAAFVKVVSDLDLRKQLLLDFDRLQERVSVKEIVKFVEVENGRICVGTEEPVGIVRFRDFSNYDLNNLVDLLVSIIRGTVVVTNRDLKNKYAHLIYELKRNKLPVSRQITLLPSPTWSLYRTKVLWTNYGTIFAN